MAQTGKITGIVTDQQGNPLPGANIIIPELNIGTASNIRGEYILTKVASGSHQLTISYIGYQKKSITVEIEAGEITNKDIILQHRAIAGESIEVKAQAVGQVQAINQQIASNTVKNIVSSKQIQSLPEANAAEAVGRLPGVSLQRNGGEGSKVVIRGLSPKYTKVQINGITMSATGSQDRSTDLSMISQYMLSGIELTKSISADQEADATGGIVNFTIKEAPSEPKLNAVLQGGYNGLSENYGNFKFILGGSNRFFDDRLGVFAQIDIEKKDASSDEMGNNIFSKESLTSPVITEQMQIRDVERIINRYNATLVMDYKTPTTKIKLNSFASSKDTKIEEYRQTFNPVSRNSPIGVLDNQGNLTIMTNSLEVEKYLGNLKVNSSFNYSYSNNHTPEQLDMSAPDINNNAFPGESGFKENINPYLLPDNITEISHTYKYSNRTETSPYIERRVGNLYHREFFTKGNQISADLNFKYDDLISLSNFNLGIKWGGKYRHTDREYDQSVKYARLSGQLGHAGKDLDIRDAYFLEFGKDELQRGDKLSQNWCERNMSAWNLGAGSNYILAYDFYDDEYKDAELLGDRYSLAPVLDMDKMKRLDNMILNHDDLSYWKNQVASRIYDYSGFEDYWAAYFMSTMELGKITFVPGLRYEKNQTEYMGYRGNATDLTDDWQPFKKWFADTTTRENEFYLPMIHMVYKPTDWLNVKAGYTKTLQRPNYNHITPTWLITNQMSNQPIVWHNFKLKPEKSRNVDLEISIYSDKIGLFSVAGFYKNIEDMIFMTGNRAITADKLPFFGGLDEKTVGRSVTYAKNNENIAIDYGFELQWHSNFWYLPGMLSGLVININYTRNFSEAKYFRNRIQMDFDENFKPIYINKDTTYTNRMIDQPDHLLNFTLGYDYKDFSIKWAIRYKSNIFTNTNWYPDLRGYSTDFVRHDLTVRQQLPIKGIKMFLNINNITNEFDKNVIHFRDYPIYERHYGRTASLGINYQF